MDTSLAATTNHELSKDRYIFRKDVGTKGNRFAIFTQNISIMATTNYWGIYFYQKYKKGRGKLQTEYTVNACS